jgi:uncharacterized protein (DUF2267 family)
VKHDAFVDHAGERAGLSDRTAAERAAVAVLQHLCDRLTGDEANDLLAQLPYELKTAVVVSPSAQPISADEFVARVGGELGISDEESKNRIRAVFATIREAVTPGEFDDVLAQLDPEYAELLA